MRTLSELSLPELWALFPITLTKPNPEWKLRFQEMKRTLSAQLPPDVRIHHIGSTALGTIWAKPIVDILIEAMPADFDTIHASLLASGWLCMAHTAHRIDYNFGYTPTGFAENVYHLHLRRFGDCDELYFLDYLRSHPQTAAEYEALKLSLWKPFEHDRDGYTEAKTDFVRRYTAEAKRGNTNGRFSASAAIP